MSQSKLAACADLNERTIAKIEAGELAVRPETRERIQRAIGCSLGALLGATSGAPSRGEQ